MTNFVTPVATTGFTAISQAYEGEFILSCRFEGEAKDQMESMIKDLLAADGRKGVVPTGVKSEMDGTTGEPTGALLVSFKLKESGVRRRDGEPFTRTLAVVDTARKPVTETVGRGSKVRVAFGTYQTEFKGQNYLKLQPKAVQIINLVAYGSEGEAAAAFDDNVDGFISSGVKEEAPAASPRNDDEAFDF